MIKITCPVCGEIFKAYESLHQEYCSYSCSATATNNIRQTGRYADTIAVDKYFNENIFDSLPGYKEVNALYYAMNTDEYDDVYGIDDYDFSEIHPRHKAYCEMAKHPEQIIILSKCSHSGKKLRHHPDYNRPLEVELICRSCHFKRHEAAIREGFTNEKPGRWLTAEVATA